MEWRPIETAPRDGTPIWIRNDHDPIEPQLVMWWNKRNKRWETYVFGVVQRRTAWWSTTVQPPDFWAPLELPPPPTS